MAKRGRKKLKNIFKRRTPPGASPGVVVADPQAPEPVMRVLAFGPDKFEEQEIRSPAQIESYLHAWPVVWVNVDGLGNAETIRQLGEVFGLHNLALEDVVNVHQRAKVEQYVNHLFIVVRIPRQRERLDTEQLSLFLGKNFVLTFLEDPGDCWDPVRERIRNARGRVRSAEADYLAYRLLDAAIDAYFPILEEYGEKLDRLEQDVFSRKNKALVSDIHEIKTDLLLLRRAVWPHREALNGLVRDPNSLISQDTRIYLRDVYDHTVQIIDLLEMYREVGSDLRELHLASVGHHMNEIMKVLTIITTIFMPLSFIAGIYGMNFKTEVSPWNMPELSWYWGYPATIAVMSLLAAGMLVFFRRKGWLGFDTPMEGPSRSNRENEVRD